jgi:hypothetical protein
MLIGSNVLEQAFRIRVEQLAWTTLHCAFFFAHFLLCYASGKWVHTLDKLEWNHEFRENRYRHPGGSIRQSI